jgi:hypothetical protein
MLRLRLNWSVIEVKPWVLTELMESKPAIVENCRSSGVATDEDIVSGLAPGKDADTWMVGYSTFGKSLTGRVRYAMIPNMRMMNVIRVVMIGRRMKSSARFITSAVSQFSTVDRRSILLVYGPGEAPAGTLKF